MPSSSSFAVLMLGWHNVWMARHGRELAANTAAGEAVVAGSKSLCSRSPSSSTVAVLREGVEVVLFFTAWPRSEGGATNAGMVIPAELSACSSAR